MKISELVAALTAELIRGNDAEIGFTVPLEVKVGYLTPSSLYEWYINGRKFHRGRATDFSGDLKIVGAEFRHREDGVMEIILT